MSQEETTSSASEELSRLRQEIAQAKEQLERIKRQKSSLLAMAVHDLRTPLAIIQGYSQLLAAELPSEDESVCDYLNNIVTHADSLGKMIENLVLLDQVERGQLRMAPERSDLDERASQAIAQVEGLTHLKRMKVDYRVDSAPIYVRTDEDQTGRILYNLLSHAIKYARPESSIRILVDRQGDFGRVSITDPNRTLNRGSLARLFDLVEVEKDGVASLQGTDIGLVLARLVAEELGGQLKAVSAAEQGLTLVLYLPIVEE